MFKVLVKKGIYDFRPIRSTRLPERLETFFSGYGKPIESDKKCPDENDVVDCS
jgi:hypothetical protein